MKYCLITAYDNAMQNLGMLTSQRMLAYASVHGMDFRVARQFDASLPAYWHKIPMMLEAFRDGYDAVMWLDADQVITNLEWRPPWTSGFHASLDWGTDATTDNHFSACGIVVYRDAMPIIQWIHDNRDFWASQPFPEQAAMRFYHLRGEQGFRMSIHPRRVFNAVPSELCETAPEPWGLGDFCCHLTHVPIPERVHMFFKVIEFLKAPPEPTADELLTSSPITNDPSPFLPGDD